MCVFSAYAGNEVIVLSIMGKGLNVRSHVLYMFAEAEKLPYQWPKHPGDSIHVCPNVEDCGVE